MVNLHIPIRVFDGQLLILDGESPCFDWCLWHDRVVGVVQALPERWLRGGHGPSSRGLIID